MIDSLRLSLKFFILSAVIVFLSGCSIQQLPDPNALTGLEIMDGRLMQRNIANAHARLDERVRKGQLSEEEKKQAMATLIHEYAKTIDVKKVPAKSAWRYADVLRQDGQWENAEILLEKAVEIAPDEDRKVNDSLQLARVKAHLGKFDEAFQLVRLTFDAKREGSAPIMMAMLYEIVPEVEGKGKDVELAELLEETIYIHQSVIVDKESESGQAFLVSRPMHINKAWAKVIKLLESAGDRKKLEQAVKSQQDMVSGTEKI